VYVCGVIYESWEVSGDGQERREIGKGEKQEKVAERAVA
jgi:hypothetical protein